MQKNQDSRLGTENITKLMISLAIPAVLAQIVNVLYNIVDRIYIGRIPGVGAAALTGVGVTFPIITIISAFSSFARGGGAPLASIALGRQPETGRKDPWKCRITASVLFCTSDAVFLCFSKTAAVSFRSQ